MAYVDGFIIPVPTKNLKVYRRIAQKFGKVWRDHGALAFRECVADDVKVGKWTSFPRSVKLKRARPWSGPTSCTSRGRIATASTPRS